MVEEGDGRTGRGPGVKEEEDDDGWEALRLVNGVAARGRLVGDTPC